MRQLGFPAIIAIALSTVLAAPALAQLPSGADCGLTLSLPEDNPSPTGFAAASTRTFTFLVENPNQVEANGELHLSAPPTGWSWTLVAWDGSVPAEGSISVDVRVNYDGSTGADAFLDAELRDVQCSGPLTGTGVQGSNGEPVSMTLTGIQADSPAPQQPAQDGGLPWAWIVFGAILLGTVVGVPYIYNQNRVRVDAVCEESESTVVPGRGTSYPIKLTNHAGDPVRVELDVADVQEGWSALTTLPDLELAGKEERTIYMMVRAPAEAKKGDLCVAKLAVTPDGGSQTTIKTLTRVSDSAEEED